MPTKPYDKDFAELLKFLKEKEIIVRIPKKGSITFWKNFKEQQDESF